MIAYGRLSRRTDEGRMTARSLLSSPIVAGRMTAVLAIGAAPDWRIEPQNRVQAV